MSIEHQAAPAVHAAIVAVSHELCELGIGKSQRNKEQGFNFRGIDDVINALSPLLVKHKLHITPRVLSHKASTSTSAKGTTWTNVVLEVEFALYSAVDGSRVVGTGIGEGRDSADKATSKAMSIAYKYWCIQAFSIPTVGVLIDGDASGEAIEHAPAAPSNQLSGDQQLLVATLETLGLDKVEWLRQAGKEMGVTLRSIADINVEWARYFVDALNTPA